MLASRAPTAKARRARALSGRRRPAMREESARDPGRTRPARRRTPRTAGPARAPTPNRRGRGARAPPREPGQLAEQPRLADPRLPDELDRDRAAPIELVQGVIERSRARRHARRGARSAGPSPSGTRINQGRLIEKSGCEIRVAPRCREGAGGKLDACPVTCFTTVMSRTNAASCSPRSGATRVPFVTVRRSARVAPAVTRSGGRSRPRRTRARFGCCRSTSPSAPPQPPVQEVEIP